MKQDLVTPLSHLATSAALVTATRPTTVAHGVSIAIWIQGTKSTPRRALVHVQADGADRTVADPTGGAAGVELWAWKEDLAGTARWWLAGILNAGADLVVIDPGGCMVAIDVPPGATRLHVAGTPSGGAPTFYIEPIEEIA